MGSRFPSIELLHPYLLEVLAAARRRYLKQGDEESFESAVFERFRRGFALPWGAAVWKEIAGAGWGLVSSEGPVAERQVAERLQVDPQRAYTGLGKGTLTTQVLVLAMAATRREPDCLPRVQPLRDDLVRSGFIDAIEYARAKTQGLDVRHPPPLYPWDYELLRMLSTKRFPDWLPHAMRFRANHEKADQQYEQFAASLACDVLDLPYLFPEHWDEAKKQRGQATLRRIADPSQGPAGYVEELRKAWLDPWLLAVSVLSPIREVLR